MTDQSSVTFRSLATRLREAKGQAALKQDAGAMNIGDLKKMQADSAFASLLDSNAGKLLKDLAVAEDSIAANPLVRYQWIAAALAETAAMISVDPEVALRLVALARAKTMPDRKTETRPLIVDFDRHDLAQKHIEDNDCKGLRPLAIPVVFNNRETGKLKMSPNVRFCAPNGRAEREAFLQVKKILETAAKSAEEIILDSFLFDVQLAAEWVARTFPRAELATDARLSSERFYIKTGEGLYKKAWGKEVVLRACQVAQDVNLLLPENDRNAALLAKLAEIRENNEALKQDEFAIDVAIVRQLRLDDMPVLTPQKFLSGEIGKVAVRRDWKANGSTADVYLLFERRTDGAWRVVFYNSAAAKMLLTSKNGEELRFTWYTGRDIPEHLAVVLRTGKLINTPADLDLSEEDVAERAVGN